MLISPSEFTSSNFLHAPLGDWIRFKRGECPICQGARKDCRQNTKTHLIHCRDTAANPPDYLFRGEDALGFGLWIHQTDIQRRHPEQQERWHSKQLIFQQRQSLPSSQPTSFSLKDKHREIFIILTQLSLNPTDRERLQQRGFTDEQIDRIGFRSVQQWHSLTGRLTYGVNQRGNLNNPCDGILCPIRNHQGQLIGLRLHNPNADVNDFSKYLSFKNSHLASGEFPLAVYGTEKAQGILGITEGLEFKPALASYRLGIPVLGHNGSNFTSSPIQSRETLEALGISIIRLFPDGGVVQNPQLVRQYQKAIALYQSWGYVVEIGWWNQLTKTDGDIDEISSDTLSQIQYLTPEQFLGLCPNHPLKRFKDWLGKQVQRVKPRGFGIPKIEGKVFTGDRQPLWFKLIRQGKAVLDASFMGSGKSHGVAQLENPDGKIWYLSLDSRNPSVKAIEENFTLLLPRNQYGFYRDSEGKLIKANAQTPPELIEIESNCIRAELFHQLSYLGYEPHDAQETEEENKQKLNPVCQACPLAKSCAHTPGMYRYERRQALAAPKIRCHPESLPRDYDYSRDLFAVDEPGQLLKPTRTIKTYWNELVVEADYYRHYLNEQQWQLLDKSLQTLKELFNNNEKWGLAHQNIVEAIDPNQFENLIETLERVSVNLKDVFPEAEELNISEADKKQYRGVYETARAHFRQAAYQTSLENLKNLPPNGLLFVLKAFQRQSGIALRIKGHTLSITLDSRGDLAAIFNRTKGLIFLDATLNSDRLRMMTGLERPIEVIRSQADKPLKNLTIQQIKVKGISSNQFSDTALKRIQAIMETLGDMPLITHKRLREQLELAGHWFKHNRGCNDFAGQPKLMAIGLPLPNVGAIEDEYHAINGSLDGFQDYYARLVQEEIQQLTGRQRVNRYLNQLFTLYFLTSEETDLSWLKEYGATINVKLGFEITPEAGSEGQYTRYRLIETIQQFIEAKHKTTQAAIAETLGKSQQAISKILKAANISLKELVKLIQKLMTKKNTTNPNKAYTRSGCVTDWLYGELNWFFDLPIEALSQEVIEEITQGGWSGFQDYLRYYPEVIQGKLLMVLYLMLTADSKFLVELLKT